MLSRKGSSDNGSSDDEGQRFMQAWLMSVSWLAEGSDGSDELFDLLFDSRPKECSKCHSADVVRKVKSRYVQCFKCGHEKSLTAGTFFNNVRCPKAWLGAIKLMAQGVEFSARMLALVANVAYATAWEIMKKIDEVLKNKLDPQAFLLPSKSFEKTFIKRSRETPAREHPRSEQRIAEKEQRQNLPTDTSNRTECERLILAIVDEKGVDFDFICEQLTLPSSTISANLVMLELLGYLERIGGDRFRRKFFSNSLAKPTKLMKRLVKQFIKYLKRIKRGISRKYLHLYLARFWCLIDRDRWKGDSLLEECLRSHHIPRVALTLENAPLMVQIPQVAA